MLSGVRLPSIVVREICEERGKVSTKQSVIFNGDWLETAVLCACDETCLHRVLVHLWNCEKSLQTTVRQCLQFVTSRAFVVNSDHG